MQEMVVRCELKIPSLGITVRHHSAGLVNSYPRAGIFNPHLKSINDSYNPKQDEQISKAKRYADKQ